MDALDGMELPDALPWLLLGLCGARGLVGVGLARAVRALWRD